MKYCTNITDVYTNKQLVKEFNKWTMCPICKFGEIETIKFNKMAKEQQAQAFRDRLDELEQARTSLSSDYYWKRRGDLLIALEAHEYLEGKECPHHE